MMSTLISTTKAAQLAGCSAKHIQNLIKRGTLSATRNDSGNYVIEKSEFYRVFPDSHKENEARTETNQDNDVSRTILESEVRHLKEMLSEKDKQIEFLKMQLDAFSHEKKMILETLNSNQKLLEHTSSKEKKKKLFGVF